MTKGSQVSLVIFFPQVSIMKLQIFLRLVFPFDLLLEGRMKVCGVYSNKFWKLDLVFRNVMEELSRKLKAKSKVCIRLYTFWKLLLNLRYIPFFFLSGPNKSMQTFSFKLKTNKQTFFLKGQTNKCTPWLKCSIVSIHFLDCKRSLRK